MGRAAVEFEVEAKFNQKGKYQAGKSRQSVKGKAKAPKETKPRSDSDKWIIQCSIRCSAIRPDLDRIAESSVGRGMRLNVRSLTTGLRFHGEVEGKRQHYYVLSSDRQYFVMSLSRAKRGSGNFNLVGKLAVEQLYRRLRGQRGVTAKRVFRRTRARRQVPSSLVALNILYVLVATGRATIDARRLSARELFFNVRA